MTLECRISSTTIRRWTLAALATSVIWAPSTAAAYVGPGAGLTFIASLLAVGAAVLIMIVGLIAFPIRLMMKAARKRREAAAASPAEAPEA